MLELTPLAKLVAVAMIALPVSLYTLYLSIEIADNIIAKGIVSNIETSCIKICNVMYSLNMCISFSMSACISLPLTYAMLRLLVLTL